jgi:hypothetical protein
MPDELGVYLPPASGGSSGGGGDSIGTPINQGFDDGGMPGTGLVIPVVVVDENGNPYPSAPNDNINLLSALQAAQPVEEVNPRNPGPALVAYLSRRISSLENRFGNLEALP